LLYQSHRQEKKPLACSERDNIGYNQTMYREGSGWGLLASIKRTMDGRR
jgi:hypothetical protein